MSKNPNPSPPDGPSGGGAPPSSHRALASIALALGGLLIAGMILVFSTITYRIVNGSYGSSAGREQATCLPAADLSTGALAGGTLGAMALSGDLLALEIRSPDGVHILLYDAKQGCIRGRLKIIGK